MKHRLIVTAATISTLTFTELGQSATVLAQSPAPALEASLPQTMEDKLYVANEAMARAGDALGPISYLQPLKGPPIIALRADARVLADELVNEFGSRIQIVLGVLPYPDPSVMLEAGKTLPCEELPTTNSKNRFVLVGTKSLKVHSGGSIENATRTFRFVGKKKVWVRSVGRALITRKGETQVIGQTGNYAVPAIQIAYSDTRIAPGKTIRPGLGIVTASCDPALGWALPPGKYTAHFVVHTDLPIGQERSVVQIPLTITNDPPPPIKRNPALPPATLPPTTLAP